MPPSAQSILKSPDPARLLSIGELADRSGVAPTALRYYDELGLVRPIARASGRRRYSASAVAEVGAIRFLREVGFRCVRLALSWPAANGKLGRRSSTASWPELAEQQHRLQVACAALEHARRCPAGDPCSARSSGQSSTDDSAGSH
jgi:DNA-binding transcriptional MerR regulator